jgi:allantoinase
MASFVVCSAQRVLLPDNNEPTPAAVVIDKHSGKIIQIRPGQLTQEELRLEGNIEWIEAGNNIVLPGLVECVQLQLSDEYLIRSVLSAHVHLNEPGRTAWEGFWTGTRAAASGGITTLVDMPLNSLPPTTTVPNLDLKRQAAKGQCLTDVAFWGGVIPSNKVS